MPFPEHASPLRHWISRRGWLGMGGATSNGRTPRPGTHATLPNVLALTSGRPRRISIMNRKTFAGLLAAALAVAVAAPAHADEEADKLAARGKALRYSVKTTEPANAIETGGAAILVNAPIDQIRPIVTDYRHYADFIKPFEQSKLISKKDGVSEVYFEVPVLHGAAKIWAVVKIGKPIKDGDGEKIVARYGNKGNVDDFRAIWRLRPIDEKHTVVKLEILVDPKMPLPPKMVTPELSYAADKAVTAVRDRAEKAAGTASERTSETEPAKKPSNVARR